MCILAVLLTASAQSSEEFQARVIGVADGDTITVLRDKIPVRIRLDGIDCPEGGQDFSQRAKTFASQMVFGKTVTVVAKDTDKYGRTVARILVDGQDLSLALVQAGLAWHYVQYSNDQVLAAAEVDARQIGIGLWSLKSPVPPWEFRRPSAVLNSQGRNT